MKHYQKYFFNFFKNIFKNSGNFLIYSLISILKYVHNLISEAENFMYIAYSKNVTKLSSIKENFFVENSMHLKYNKNKTAIFRTSRTQT